MLHIRENVIKTKPRDIWNPKDGDQRVIPLGGAAITVLRALPRRGRWVFLAPVSTGHPTQDRRVNECHVLTILKGVLEQLGLPGHTHTFRHSLISYALVSGTPESVEREWAGHVDSEILWLYPPIADEDSKSHMEGLFPEELDHAQGSETDDTFAPEADTGNDDDNPSEQKGDGESGETKK